MYSVGETTSQILTSMNTCDAINMGGQAVSSLCNSIGSIYAQAVSLRMQKAQYATQEYITNLQKESEIGNLQNEQVILQDVASISVHRAKAAEEAAQAHANLEVTNAELAQQRQTRSFGNPVESS
ncbi:MAG: hypothetical protein ABH859_07170 [Pseudomonadota bacterium]